jgi:phage terminase large subunit-like protein
MDLSIFHDFVAMVTVGPMRTLMRPTKQIFDSMHAVALFAKKKRNKTEKNKKKSVGAFINFLETY